MGCSNSSVHCLGTKEADGVSVPSMQRVLTIREVLDKRIENTRKHVEDLCITKAKLEALNVLDHPVDLYQSVMF